MATATSERAMRNHQLDRYYQEGLHRIELVNRDETERRLSLKTLALRDANAALQDLASEKELHISSLGESIETLKIELLEAQQRSSEQHSGLEKQRNEIRSLKADIESLVSSAEASNDAVQEKATLTRQLNNLRPELEQLKSQLLSHQAVVASNGDLRHQVNTLEVELENERRSKLRAQQADENGVISDLRSRLEQHENRLQTEKTEKEGLERELAESRGETKEQKELCNALKFKLKETQDALKAAQVSLQKSQRELSKRREISTSIIDKHQENAPKARQARAANLQKSQRELPKPSQTSTNTVDEHQETLPESKQARVLVEACVTETSMDDVNIQTPVDENILEIRRLRRRGTEHALLGEKSNFSITPFLNKSKDATDYPDLNSEKSTSGVDLQVSPEQPRPTKKKRSRATSPIKARRLAASREKRSASLVKDAAETEAILSNTLLNEFDTPVKPGTRGRPRSGKATDARRVNDSKEDSDSDTASRKPESKSKVSTTESNAPKDHEAEGRRRKRKLLGGRGKTMFDDDEMEVHDKPGNPLRLVPAKRARSQGGGVTNAFAGPGSTFSPLKKERRGVNASFIG
ncbi:hypothetical protein LMH87_000983 [Akanthomyces muscarius]|uniref:Rossmann-fold NAD(P)(+)-binding protein n=1 Tax=Akanthomyces muscarius TaxID=2231603 RepID=A0A9W8UN29_AKAMU|nr:hypothetical protein LMH87_000983 [Akanthomyces muscarius]KAJ4155752.1 hypothetical protein LMH87_000983 [Akanthomyces muscarius]